MWQNNFGCVRLTLTRIFTMGAGEKNPACVLNCADGEGISLISAGNNRELKWNTWVYSLNFV